MTLLLIAAVYIACLATLIIAILITRFVIVRFVTFDSDQRQRQLRLNIRFESPTWLLNSGQKCADEGLLNSIQQGYYNRFYIGRVRRPAPPRKMRQVVQDS